MLASISYLAASGKLDQKVLEIWVWKILSSSMHWVLVECLEAVSDLLFILPLEWYQILILSKPTCFEWISSVNSGHCDIIINTFRDLDVVFLDSKQPENTIDSNIKLLNKIWFWIMVTVYLEEQIIVLSKIIPATSQSFPDYIIAELGSIGIPYNFFKDRSLWYSKFLVEINIICCKILDF